MAVLEAANFKWVSGTYKFGKSLWDRIQIGDLLKGERQEFAKRCVTDLLDAAQKAAALAHTAVLASPNDPKGQDTHIAAVVEGSSVCRRATAAFAQSADDPRLPLMLREAISGYRFAVTNDDNLSAVTPEERQTREAAINDATLYLETEVRRSAYRVLGAGTGRWAGKTAARGAPDRQ